jgi:hypothetical protein
MLFCKQNEADPFTVLMAAIAIVLLNSENNTSSILMSSNA